MRSPILDFIKKKFSDWVGGHNGFYHIYLVTKTKSMPKVSFLKFLVIIYNTILVPMAHIRALSWSFLPLIERKLLMCDCPVLSQKLTHFPFFGRSYLGHRLTYIAENLHRIFLSIICKCAKFHRNWRGSRKFSKKLVDLTRNNNINNNI